MRGREGPGERLGAVQVLGSRAAGESEGDVAEGGQLGSGQLAVESGVVDSRAPAAQIQKDRQDLTRVGRLNTARIGAEAVRHPRASPSLDLHVDEQGASTMERDASEEIGGWHGAPKGAQPAVVSAWIALHPL